MLTTNYEWANVVDPSASDLNRYHGPDQPEPLDGHDFIHLTGPHAWSMVDAWRYHEQQVPCVVCGHTKGGPNTLRASRGRRGLIHCCHCNTASTDGVVAYFGEPVDRRLNEGWEASEADGQGQEGQGEQPPTGGGVKRAVKFRPAGIERARKRRAG